MHEYTKQEQITILQGEIEVFKGRIDLSKPKIDILYLTETISMLELRVKELIASSIPITPFNKK